MSASGSHRRPLEQVRAILLERARRERNPFDFSRYEDVERALGSLRSLDRDEWAEAFSSAARRYEQRAREREAAGDAAGAAQAYRLAYGLYRAARYPAPNSPAKRDAYRRSLEVRARVAALAYDPPEERVEMPFRGRPGEGSTVVGLLRRPRRAGPHPLLVLWGGIDSFKEERRTEPYVAAGMATLAVDMPGVGEAPIPGSEDAERLWDAVFDWAAAQPDLDAGRLAVLGASTGGYWATKLAHTRRERLRAAVNHGGPAHFAFTAEWIERAQGGEYPLELAETLACAFGLATYEDWVGYAPRLSLLAQGVLDRPCCPLLCVNGVDDSVFPIADHHLLLERGEPKSARFFPGGHMGDGPEVTPTIVRWLARALDLEAD